MKYIVMELSKRKGHFSRSFHHITQPSSVDGVYTFIMALDLMHMNSVAV